MKKGSRIRKCYICGTHLFWIIPTKIEFGIFQTADIKEIRPYTALNGHYCCLECAKKASQKGEQK